MVKKDFSSSSNPFKKSIYGKHPLSFLKKSSQKRCTEKEPFWKKASGKILILIMFLVVLSFSVNAVYDPTKDRIGIDKGTETGTENMEHMNNTLFANGTKPVGAVFECIGNGICITYKTIVINKSTTNLSLGHPTNFSFGRVLRLNGSSGLQFPNANPFLNITNFNITSWDNTSDTRDFIIDMGIRGFIGDRVNKIFIKNSTFMYLGNSSWGSGSRCAYGLCFNSIKNSVIKDSKFYGVRAIYSQGIGANWGNNSIITNNKIVNSVSGIALNKIDGLNVSFNNISIIDSTLRPFSYGWSTSLKSKGITLSDTKNINIFNNNINNTFYAIYLEDRANNTKIYKNNILGNYSRNSLGIFTYISNVKGLNIYNNTINKTHMAIDLEWNTTDINITNNIFRNNDLGIYIRNTSSSHINARIYNNTFYNNTFKLDGMSLSVRIRASNNINIWQNNFSHLTKVGVWIKNSNNISIKNNDFDFVPISTREHYTSMEWGMQTATAIAIPEIWDQWLSEFDEKLPTDNITYVRMMTNSENISISGNTFDDDTMVYLWTQRYGNGTLVHDLDPSTYWFRSFQMPTELVDRDMYWINNNYKNLTTFWGDPNNVNRRVQLKNLVRMYSGSYSSMKLARINYTIAKTYMWFQRVNLTHMQNVSLFNISSYTIINISNGTVLTTNSPATFNFSLAPLRKVYAIDKIHLDETVSLTHMLSSDDSVISPSIWFSSTSNTLKKIASNLSSSVPVTLTLNVAGCNLKNIVINYPDGTSKNLFDYSYRCENSIVTVQNVPIMPSADSNEIHIEYWMQETNPYAGGSSGSESTTTITTTSLLVTTTLTPLQSAIQEKAKEAVQQAIANIKMYPALWVIISIFLLFMIYKPFNKERKILYTILSVITLILFFWKYDFIFNKASYYVYNTLPSLILKLPLFLQFNVNSISHLPSIIIIVLMALILYIIKKIVVMTK